MRKHVRDHQAAVTTRLELPVLLADQSHLAEKDIGLLVGLKCLPVEFLQFRLVVKRVHMTESSDETDVDCSFRLRFKLRERRFVCAVISGRGVVADHRQQRGSSQPIDSPVEEITTRR